MMMMLFLYVWWLNFFVARASYRSYVNIMYKFFFVFGVDGEVFLMFFGFFVVIDDVGWLMLDVNGCVECYMWLCCGVYVVYDVCKMLCVVVVCVMMIEDEMWSVRCEMVWWRCEDVMCVLVCLICVRWVYMCGIMMVVGKR